MTFEERKEKLGNRLQGLCSVIRNATETYPEYWIRFFVMNLVTEYVPDGDKTLKGKLNNFGRNLVKYANDEGMSLSYKGDDPTSGLTLMELCREIGEYKTSDVITIYMSTRGYFTSYAPLKFGKYGGSIKIDSTITNYLPYTEVTLSTTRLNIGNHTITIQGLDSSEGYPEFGFYQKSPITSVTFNGDHISYQCFNEIKNITTFTGKRVEWVHDWGLNNIAPSTGVTINLPVCTEIKEGGCAYQSKVNMMNMPKLKIIGPQGFNNSRLTESNINFQDSVEVIGDNGLNKNKFVNLTLSKVKSVGYHGLGENYNMTSLSMPMVETLGEQACTYCTSLVTAYMPKLKEIGSKCFDHNYNLSNITFGPIEYIGDHAFANTSISNIDLSYCTRLYEGCFDFCTNLTSINAPALTYCEGWIFNGCTSLTTLKTPVLEEINGNSFFSDCSQSIDWYVPDTPPVAVDGLFTGYTGTIKLHVRSEAIRDAYKSSTGFTSLTNDNFIIEDW